MSIPRMLHAMWIGDATKRPACMMDTWKNLNPSCRYILWTEENLQYFGFENQKQIDLMTELNGKCDIMRWEILSRMGGVFVDADSECILPLADSFFDNEAFLCYENEMECKDLLACCVMGFSENNPITRLAIDGLHGVTEFKSDAWMACGPLYITNIVKAHPELPIMIYPSHYFIPEHGWYGYKYSGEGKVYAHHYGGSTFQIYGTLK